MKKTLLALILVAISYMGMAQTATDFTVDDCSGNSHNLFTELDAGKVVVLCWVMPCPPCVGPSFTTYNVVQSYAQNYPNTVYMYLCDDYANTACASINSWANTNGLTNTIRFSNKDINMKDYGTTGMPKIVVVGGANHTVFYNANNSVDATDLQKAINTALTATNINDVNSNASTLSVFPNPSGNFAEVKFSLTKTSDIALELFNIEGKFIQTIYSGKLDAGENKIKINLDAVSSGMYLVKFSDGTANQFINFVKAN
ncbi:MAG: T9SS type A sorting domain-containing protein [Sphingobacteriales bacterium]|jgi:hypothetical protein|nr:T9SS type A sorting domain-containing protein [Sphingobacteriales bacterium]MBP9141217.1 T9SS type A sorting domain-containing protein [Chitinophagales bacterium]MDA0199082.1 T9SS type A sorting domain-containing protein [Bacteroidota bacterium]MBK6890440.1 T9SS type A sorting domain-containing protein [Sphingobacteriales bacterium]MBK7526508.1 T9SS type A sorting domain-containing protein [Sphingobacteriales bacterium]